MDDKIWTKLKISLKKSIGENNFNNWLSPINFSYVDEDMAVFTVPTNFLGNYVSQNWGELITEQISSENNKISRIRFEVDTKSNNFGDSQTSAPAHINVQKDNELAGAQLDKRFRFDAFVVGKPIELQIPLIPPAKSRKHNSKCQRGCHSINLRYASIRSKQTANS